jgi:hypothetical protein
MIAPSMHTGTTATKTAIRAHFSSQVYIAVPPHSSRHLCRAAQTTVHARPILLLPPCPSSHVDTHTRKHPCARTQQPHAHRHAPRHHLLAGRPSSVSLEAMSAAELELARSSPPPADARLACGLPSADVSDVSASRTPWPLTSVAVLFMSGRTSERASGEAVSPPLAVLGQRAGEGGEGSAAEAPGLRALPACGGRDGGWKRKKERKT